MIKSVLDIMSQYKIRTFTYYVPSPPKRKTGYQEKEFDQLVSYINSEDFKICKIQTQNDSSGMWVILQIRPMNKKANEKELEYSTEVDSKEDIELSL